MPLQPVSSERNHQVADKFRKVSCLNVYGRKRGRVGVLNLNQWKNGMPRVGIHTRVGIKPMECPCGKNTQNVIEWFGNIKEKHRHSFISFDIVDFYPSISENLLDQALSWASNLAIITKDEISIIKHARKSVHSKKSNSCFKKKKTHFKKFFLEIRNFLLGRIARKNF